MGDENGKTVNQFALAYQRYVERVDNESTTNLARFGKQARRSGREKKSGKQMSLGRQENKKRQNHIKTRELRT